MKAHAGPVLTRLCFLVNVILSLPPLFADTERLFSDSSFTLIERHQRLDAQQIDDLMVVKGNSNDVHTKFIKEEDEIERKMQGYTRKKSAKSVTPQ